MASTQQQPNQSRKMSAGSKAGGKDVLSRMLQMERDVKVSGDCWSKMIDVNLDSCLISFFIETIAFILFLQAQSFRIMFNLHKCLITDLTGITGSARFPFKSHCPLRESMGILTSRCATNRSISIIASVCASSLTGATCTVWSKGFTADFAELTEESRSQDQHRRTQRRSETR